MSAYLLSRHALRVWRGGQARFRVETFGLYFPALPYTTPWWNAPRRNAVLLMRQARSYAAWVLELESIRQAGASAWWDHRIGPGQRPGPDWEG